MRLAITEEHIRAGYHARHYDPKAKASQTCALAQAFRGSGKVACVGRAITLLFESEKQAEDYIAGSLPYPMGLEHVPGYIGTIPHHEELEKWVKSLDDWVSKPTMNEKPKAIEVGIEDSEGSELRIIRYL